MIHSIRNTGFVGGLKSLAAIDTDAFIALVEGAGGSISNDERTNLLNFATALYSLVGRNDFWPMRSTQNVGSGTTIYSFHGVIGSIIGTVEWHADGIRKTTSLNGGVIIEDYAPILSQNPISSFGVHAHTGTVWGGDFSNLFWMWGNYYGATTNMTSGGWIRAANGVGVLNQMRGATEIAQSFTDSVFSMHSNTTIDAGSNNSLTYKNGSSPHTATVSTVVSPAASGSTSYRVGYSDGALVEAFTPFHMVIAENVDATQHQEIYDLYKATLGHDLGLP